MKLESQVCSLELAKKLKELGVKQHSYFYWAKEEMSDSTYKWNLITGELQIRIATPGMIRDSIAAFTVAELGEMLPAGYVSYQSPNIPKGNWFCWQSPRSNQRQEADTEAHARAKMLVYLIENKLIRIADPVPRPSL